MDEINERALLLMKDIINDYLNEEYDRNEAVSKLTFVDHDVIHCSSPELMVTDCYYTIAHLTEVGYETTDFELEYFRDCINGTRKYDLDEKMGLIREYYKGNVGETKCHEDGSLDTQSASCE